MQRAKEHETFQKSTYWLVPPEASLLLMGLAKGEIIMCSPPLRETIPVEFSKFSAQRLAGVYL